jgi:hypothetical protein
MDDSFEQYGTGSGLVLGAGVGATAALVAGLQSEMAVLAGFGASGGLVVGSAAGRFLGSHRQRENWIARVVAFTLLVSLLVGGLLGALTGWMVDGSLADGVFGGSTAGGAFSLLLSGVLVAAGRDRTAAGSSTAGDSTADRE